ncbi:unknown protein [Seminavis robusta]|uniref:SAM domain-containing protein n=1 Tax=Seminavis robusta TaxID=568900 RepID=A0A9N8HG86_9STRA|nr:unknown protein [Seminavis robusta]CAB9513787.1 unknown protein [Seminavis robusta]|eukprot:Sro563_g167220.1 n/a (217) ;mRNA; f:37900-38550
MAMSNPQQGTKMTTSDLRSSSSWTCDEVAAYFHEKAGELGGDFGSVFKENKISGKVAHKLTESQLTQMGIDNVGDRMHILEEIEKIKRSLAKEEIEKVLWEGEEVLYWSSCHKAFETCCGLLPRDPSTYKLTATHLTLNIVEPLRCGPIVCCFGEKFTTDNTDLSMVTDVDVAGGRKRSTITVQTKFGGGTKTMTLRTKEAKRVADMILSQRMERA